MKRSTRRSTKETGGLLQGCGGICTTSAAIARRRRRPGEHKRSVLGPFRPIARRPAVAA